MIGIEQDIGRVWVEYKNTGSGALRNKLMEHYLPLVKATADRISAKLPNEVDVDDLISAGIFGLIDAIEAFDLDRGVKFETYCSPRVRGAILDELRTMDWVPRLVRSRAHKLENATKVLRAELGRLPTDDEIARKLVIGRDELNKIMRDATTVSLVSLSRKFFDDDSNRELQEIDVLEDLKSADPVAELQQNEIRDVVMGKLTKIERLIIVLYYYEEMTMKEIGATLDLSESRVSQMHSGILDRLKHHLKPKSQTQYTY
ncbi:MAG: FliA/WhiG family RNA polymerase sigma factor [Planctomycetota bacterium]|nr:MAG: FliA/WhiG family RNA polymerase sigma factor [Planctomycetota bacterium]